MAAWPTGTVCPRSSWMDEEWGQACSHGAVVPQDCSGQGGTPKRPITGASWSLRRLSVGVGPSLPDPGSLPTAVAQRLNRPNWIFNVAKTCCDFITCL